MKVQNENVEHDGTYNKSKGNNILIVSLLIIIIILLIILIYLVITNPAVKKESGPKNDYVNEGGDNGVSETDSSFYLIYYLENCLIGIKSDGSKEVLVSGVTNKYVSYSVYKNILYYIDNIHDLHSFDLESRKDVNLNIKVSEDDDWNMYVGDNFLILTGVRKVLKYSLTDGKMELLPFEIFNYNYLDSDNNLFYYTASDNKLYSYNLVTKENLPLANAADSRIIYGYGSDIIYAKHANGGDTEQFYLYDSKTQTSTLYNDIELNSAFIYNGKIFAIDDKKVVAFDGKEKEVIAVFDNVDLISSIHLVKDSILVNTANIDKDSCNNADDVCMPARVSNSYLVAIKNGDRKKLGNSYETLFEGIPNFVYVR